jgi:cytochrome P450/NADPH-cytochrome P450 reductase
MMGAPLVIVAGHDLIDELSDEKRFDKAVRGSLRRVRAVGGDGLFTADTNEPNWSKAHNILLQPFGNRAMQSYHPSMVDIAEQLVKKWERLNGDEEIDVVHDMTALTLDTIGLCGFDYRFNSFYRRDYHPFVESLVRSLETIMMTRGMPLEGLWLQKRRKTSPQDVAFMNKMVDEIIAERRGNAEAAEGKKDMLGAMMTGVDRATGEQLDDVNIRYQINTFLIAGHETTSGLLSCTIYALLKHPEVLKKAYEEVDRVLGPDINARPTYQQVTQLTYITQILKEALRLWPPAPAYGIAPLQDETDRRQVQAEEEHVCHGARDGAAPRSQRLGAEPGCLRSREFQPRGRGQAPDQRLESRSATASAPASAAALRCTRRRSRSA